MSATAEMIVGRKYPTKYPNILVRRNRNGKLSYVAEDGGGANRAFPKLEEARAWKSERDAARAKGEISTSRVTLHEYIDGWLAEERRAGQLRENTIAEYERLMTKFVKRYFSNRVMLGDVTPGDVTKLVDWLGDSSKHVYDKGKRKGKPRTLSVRTKRNIVAPLSKMFSFARARDDVRDNPARGIAVAPPRRKVGPSSLSAMQVKVFSREQLDVVLTTAPERYKLFFATLAMSGMRVSEAVALRWAHVYREGQYIGKDLGYGPAIAVVAGHRRGVTDALKSEAGTRIIPIDPTLSEALEEIRREDDRLVFHSNRDTELDADNVRRRFLKPVVEEAGAPWAAFHTFRHTYASILFDSGMKVEDVSDLLGHSSLDVTQDIYRHMLPGEKRQGATVAMFKPRKQRPALPVPEADVVDGTVAEEVAA
jgi:integrase